MVDDRDQDNRVAELLMANKVLQAEIADRKHAEAAHAEVAARFRLLFDSSVDPVFVQDQPEREAGALVAVNDAACRFVACPREELVKKSLLDLVPLDHRDSVLAALRQLGPRERTRIESVLTAADSVPVEVEIELSRLELDSSPVFVATCRDLSEQKLDELEHRQINAANVHSEKMAAIAQLSSGIAHDFNNLLTSIMSNSEMLAEDLVESDPLREPVSEILQAANRAAGLTRRLLIFSRQQVLKPEITDINAVVTRNEPLLRRVIGGDVQLTCKLDADIGRVMADPAKLDQVIMNLALNARDSMPGGGQLLIETRNVQLDQDYARQHTSVKAGPHVMIAVSDTGVGMDGDTLARIFEPYFTTKDRGRDSGLGLPIAYGIIKQSGGNIWAYSEVGKGSSLKIYFPRVDRDSPGDTPAQEPRRAASHRETILLVEDEGLTRRVARRILQKAGYTVLEAENGQEALRFCKHHPEPIHLLVTDIILPSVNGLELAEEFSSQRHETRVLYMSGFTSDLLVQQRLLGEGAVFLEKPFTPTVLKQKVREALATPAPAP